MSSFPLFVVPGMPRAGTTFLYHYLQKHPDIFLPYRKEIDYFNDIYSYKGPHWYRSLFEEREQGQICGDLSPACWFEPKAIEYIKAFDPSAKVILSIRDPADFAVSLLRQKRHSHYDLPQTIDEFIDQGYESKLSEDGGSVYFKFSPAYFEGQVERYKQAFGTNLLIYDFKFFQKNQLSTLCAIERFLNVKPYFNESNFDNLRINASSRRNLKFLYALTTKDWLRNFVEGYMPSSMVRQARGFVDRVSVAGTPSKNPAASTHDPVDVGVARKKLSGSRAAFADLFSEAPIMLGDGSKFEFDVQV